MNRKNIALLFSVLIFVIAFSLASGDALSYGEKMMHSRKGMGEKILYKAHFMMVYQEELGLSEEQVIMIRNLKHDVKKEVIKQNAEIDVLAVDIKSLLYEDTVDLVVVNQLIDQKYDLKKAKAKYLVDSYVKLKNILSEDQIKILKSLWHKQSKAMKMKPRGS